MMRLEQRLFRPEHFSPRAFSAQSYPCALPMTFVDDAELVWRRLDAGDTQQAVADALGWSRGQISNYAALSGIAQEAWQIIATTIRSDSPPRQDCGVADVATGVAFSENLLRSILPLRPDQQVELVRRLARGKCSKVSTGQVGMAAMADARRNKLTDAYAAVREAARERMNAAGEHGVKGGRGNMKTPVELIPQGFEDGDACQDRPDRPPAPKTRDIRAKAAGTNAKYIDLADRARRWRACRRPDCGAVEAERLHNAYMNPGKQKGQSFELA